MFPKFNHFPLRESQEFFRTARSIHTRYLSVFWLPAAPDQDRSRGAIIVKKTTAPLATQRSAIKRKMRAVILPHLVNSPTKRDMVFLFKAKPTTTSKELEIYVTEVFAKLS